MLSGAKLMDYRERYGTRTYFAKRFKKTVVPWVFWSMVALLFYISAYGTTIPVVLKGFVIGLWHNSLLPVFWFFTPLFGVYLSIPLISLWKERRRLLWCFAGTLLFFGIGWSGWQQLLTPGRIGDLRFPISGYLGYAILGYLLNLEKYDNAGEESCYLLSGSVRRYFLICIYPFEFTAQRCDEHGFVRLFHPLPADERWYFRFISSNALGMLVSRSAIRHGTYASFGMWVGCICNPYVFN